MALWIWTLSIWSCFCITLSRNEELKFFQSATELNHLTVDNDTGIVYLGVVNALYQLTENLEVIRIVKTGPRKDNKKCTPPIDENQCKEAVLTDNYNKLLLLNKVDKTIVVCGSLFKGICAIRDLEDISKEKYYVDSSGEKSFVASNDENVSTVGLITSLNNDRVLFVGKGNGPNDNGIIISTRQLYDRDGKDIFEMYTDSAAVKSAYHSSSTQQFVAVFEDKNYVYFIFNQQEKQPVNNRTLIARLCKDDAHYYSYFEMDLGCKDDDGAYDHCHSAYVTTPGEELAEINKDSGSLKSAMCVFSLRHINEKMERNRNDCYTKKNTSSFYKLFSAENPCASHGLNASKNFPCGSEHLPYLLGSKNGVVEKPVLQKEGMNLTAVIVAVENGHTVAFLGTSDGKILKVFLSSTATEYSSLTIELNKPIKNDLVLDQTQENLYVMTTDKVHQLPVQDCHKYSDCEKCTQARDPYCGWCVREGRCTKKADCETADKENHWLWSPSGTCMTIISANPQNMSRRAPTKVELTVSPLPTLTESDQVLCTFGETTHYAQLKEGIIICDPPDIIPPTPKHQDHVSVPLQLTFGKNKIFFASHTYPFYDCEEAMNLFENQPCYSCASNRWNCQWDWKRHICEESSSVQDVIKQNMEEECPQFLNPNPPIIPMEYRTTVYFEGRHLAYYQVTLSVHILHTAPLNFVHKISFPSYNTLNILKREENVLSACTAHISVTLYNCSYGRSDCSLCLAAHRDYKCVWCEEDGKPSKCVYEKLCHAPPTNTCPHPEITRIEPETGPLNGRILLTIMGSNLGITAEDVKHITVADEECVFKEEFYSVSTRIVCQVGPMNEPKQGQIEVDIDGKLGKSPSEVLFTYQEPHPSQIRPQSGPQAGGTTLTITGTHLATGSKKDVQVSVGSQPCNVGGRNITVTGTGFELIQSFSLVVHAERPEAGKMNLKRFEGKLVKRLNETTVVFSSPPILEDPENYNITTIILMDHYHLVVKNESHSFTYVADPTFENFTDGIKKQVNKLINAKGSNLNKAMTIDEAQAFVGDESCNIKTLTETDLYCEPPEVQPQPKKRQKRDTINNLPEFIVKFGLREWILGRVEYDTRVSDIPLNLILPLVLIPMIAIIIISIICYRRKSQQAEREYEKIKSQLEGLEESVRDRCKKEFTDLMIEMEDQTNDINEAGIPVLDYKTYTDRVFFLPSKDGEKDVMITGKLDIPEARRQTVEQALNQFSNLLNSKSFLINFIHTLENQREFSARAKVYFASLLTVALHGKLEYYTDIMRTLFLELMEQYVVAKNPKLMLRRSETVVERMLSNWMSICLYQYLKDNAGEPLYKLFKAIKHQVEKGPVDAVLKKAKYTLNDTGLLGDDVEYTQLTVNVYVQDGGTDSIPVKVLNCDTISQVKEKIIDQVYRNLPCSQWPKAESVVLEWRPGSTAQILSDLDLTSQRDGRWKRINTLMHYNVRDGATLILSKMGISQQPEDNQQDVPGERHALLEDENKVWHLVRPVDEIDEGKSKRGSVKEKERTKAITEIYLTRLLSVKGTLQQFVDNFFHSVLNSNHVVPPAVKYFFDFLDEQAEKHDIKDEDTIHIWKTNSLPLRFWVNILKNPHFIFDVHVHEVVDASLSVIAQTFMDACTRTEHKLSRDSPSNKLLYAKEISNYKKMVEDYYKGIRQMVPVSDQDMNTHLAEISRAHTDSLNTLVALHQLYQYTNKYYDEIINALEEDPAAQKMQLAFRLQQIAAALENKVTDL
uniref:Plexin-B2 n=1 Tax=Amazona collaria TaxID=241587 RepID=A0A8B9FA04_9PSIT